MASAAPPLSRRPLARVARAAVDVGAVVRRVAFWVSVAIPLSYLPFVLLPGVVRDGLATVGLVGQGAVGAVLVTLVAVHLVSALVGHGHPGRVATE